MAVAPLPIVAIMREDRVDVSPGRRGYTIIVLAVLLGSVIVGVLAFSGFALFALRQPATPAAASSTPLPATSTAGPSTWARPSFDRPTIPPLNVLGESQAYLDALDAAGVSYINPGVAYAIGGGACTTFWMYDPFSPYSADSGAAAFAKTTVVNQGYSREEAAAVLDAAAHYLCPDLMIERSLTG